ncbi:MAG: HpcH/HpaI aldolase family protein [Candidatus Dormibacteraceae bacterium]
MPLNRAKAKLRSGEVILGHSVFEFATPGIGRILQAAGADYAGFDMEHAGFGIDTIRQLISYTRGTTVTPCVRVPTTRYEYIAGVLDAGAQGIWVPLVESREQVERMVSAARYAPLGNRGIAYGISHDDFIPGDPIQKMQDANEQVLLVAMIESAKGLENLEEIASHPGLDMIWIGHYDLAASLGVPGDIRHPKMLAAFDRLLSVSRKYGKYAGRGINDVDAAVQWIHAGFQAISYSRDIIMFQSNLASQLRQVRERIQTPS